MINCCKIITKVKFYIQLKKIFEIFRSVHNFLITSILLFQHLFIFTRRFSKLTTNYFLRFFYFQVRNWNFAEILYYLLPSPLQGKYIQLEEKGTLIIIKNIFSLMFIGYNFRSFQYKNFKLKSHPLIMYTLFKRIRFSKVNQENSIEIQLI